jgi:hypothetical protein
MKTGEGRRRPAHLPSSAVLAQKHSYQLCKPTSVAVEENFIYIYKKGII